MTSLTILSEAELRRIVRLDRAAIECIESAFRDLATQTVAMPPILRLDLPEHRGEVDVKTAHVEGASSFAIKISPGFFDNPKLGLPSVNGLMILLSATTGLAEALLLDNGYLTDIRTAAAGAVAARFLAREDSTVAAVIGAGVQAGLQLEAAMLVRPIEEARLWARDHSRAAAAAAALTKRLGILVRAASEPRAAIDGADIVITATPAAAPLLQAGWISPGQHITAMGSDAPHKNELDPAILAQADPYVADRLSQTQQLGELHHAIQEGLIDPDADFPELGAVVAGLHPGRRSSDAVTVADLTGTGAQDSAIAMFARDRAAAAGAGLCFDNPPCVSPGQAHSEQAD